jgi:MFS family permease
MNQAPTLFEARNVLDRMESSGNTLLDLKNRSQYLKIFMGTFIGRALVGLPLLFVIPLTGWLTDSMGLLTGIVLGISIWLAILLILGLVMGLSEIAMYQALSGDRDTDPRIILQRAWAQIGSWFAYIGWSAVVFWGIVITGLMLWGGIFAHELGFMGSTLSGSSWVNGSTITVWILSTIGLFCGLIWFSTSISPGKPQYILSGKTDFWSYLELRHLSEGRWWRVFWNFLLASFIVGLAIGIFDGIFSSGLGVERIFELLSQSSKGEQGLLGGTGSLDPVAAKAKLTQFIDQLDTGMWLWSFLTSLLSIALSVIAAGFLQAFNFKVGRDIATQAASTHESV